MKLNKIVVFVFVSVLFAALAVSVSAEALPMDNYTFGSAPQQENYISADEYQDSSMSVKLYTDTFADTTYSYAHVKISHPSQLRTAPAGLIETPKATFRSSTTSRGRLVARAVNAVVAINGDYHTKSDKCQVVLRMSQQVRNNADGSMDLLVIDKEGNLSALQGYNKDDYAAFYEANKENLYQVFCFGPLLCQDGASVIAPDYENRALGAQNSTQRSAICQIGPLEYLLVTCEGPQSKGSKGMTLPEFAALCEMLGKKHNEESGCFIAFNLDGGNSSTLVFKGLNNKKQFAYIKYNCPDIERFLSDIIYFATLEK